MVQKGMFYAGTLRLDKRLKVLLLPMLAMPSRPILREVPGRPRRILFWTGVLVAKWERSCFVKIMEINDLVLLIGVIS